MKSNQPNSFEINSDPDIIVYQLVSKGGGMDGMDSSFKGGTITAAYFTRYEAEGSKNLPWNNIVPIVVNIKQAKKAALDKLNPIDKLVLGLS
jgi:hypothetical protein